MKQIILLFNMVCAFGFFSMALGQVTQFPYDEGFDNEIFKQGTDVYFISNWLGNYVDDVRIFQEDINVNNGTGALGLWPIPEEGQDGEEVEIIAQVDLDLTGLDNVVAKFWVATVATGYMKHVKLYMKVSLDGGYTFGPKVIIGPDPRGFMNVDTPYQEFLYALHPNASYKPKVVLQFMAKAGAKKGTPAKILIDDVHIYSAPEDIFPPVPLEPKVVNIKNIALRFSEPLDPVSATDIANYTFTAGPTPPDIFSATLTSPDMVTLTVLPQIQIGKYYDLEMANIKDLAGNVMNTSVAEFIYNPLTSGLVITEILYDEPPVGHKDNLEFIELYNATANPIELGGLRIKGGIASGKLPEYTLEPGAYWVTAKDAVEVSSFFNVPAYEWHGGNLSNDDPEKLYILNTDHHSGVTVDSLTYRNGPPWPGGAAGLGYSLELIDPDSDNSDPANWSEALNYCGMYQGYDIYASPGQPRVILGVDEVNLTDSIRIYPNPVSDKLFIDSEVELTKIELYSSLGKKIKAFDLDLKSIKTDDLSVGMYLVKLYTNNDVVTTRIIKN